MTLSWSHYKQHYSSDFIMVRRAVFLNFVNANADIIEENLTPVDVAKLIGQAGKDYARKSKRKLTIDDLR